MTELVLASSSVYRRALLERLGLPFAVVDPAIDETPEPGEYPGALAARLAARKARAAGAGSRVVIGSDQTASLDGQLLGKPGTRAAALAQLEACQGRTVVFHTAVAVHDGSSKRTLEHLDVTRVEFARRTRPELERYIELEPALNCAGGFKVEGLGIALFEQVESKDPTALVGLPLIWLARTLRQLGLDPMAPTA